MYIRVRLSQKHELLGSVDSSLGLLGSSSQKIAKLVKRAHLGAKSLQAQSQPNTSCIVGLDGFSERYLTHGIKARRCISSHSSRS